MSISVSDLFGAASDIQMPTLALALDPVQARKELKRRLPRLSGTGRLRLRQIRVIRYKPGRRCVLEYDVQLERPGHAPEEMTLIGKVRARRFGNESFRLMNDLWKNGFSAEAPDGVSIPEPMGVVSRFHMWFQRKVAGETATTFLRGPRGVDVAIRVAEAIHKVHCANVPAGRRHGMEEELHILHECFAKIRALRPDLEQRIDSLAAACDRLGASLPLGQCRGIHRDFYPAQVIVNDNRLYLIDFDLYCLGDPALDVGNFLGHMIEQALRELHDPAALLCHQQALVGRFVQLAGRDHLPAISVYTTLTVARHVFLSTTFPERANLTSALLDLCERRIAEGASSI